MPLNWFGAFRPNTHPVYTWAKSSNCKCVIHTKNKTYFSLTLLKKKTPAHLRRRPVIYARHRGTELWGYFPLPVKRYEHIRPQDFVRSHTHKPEHQIFNMLKTLCWQFQSWSCHKENPDNNSSIITFFGKKLILITTFLSEMNWTKIWTWTVYAPDSVVR